MGLYDTYGKIGLQVKCGGAFLNNYHVGNKTTLPDGIYVGYEGAIAIYKGKFVAEAKCLTDKWGGYIPCRDIIGQRNPILKALEDLKKSPKRKSAKKKGKK
jgi:hypothetical protein